MKVTEKTIQSINITGVKDIDAIDVFIQDYRPGSGEITIKCWGESWTHYWGAMGGGQNLISFFLSASSPYLAGKLTKISPKQIIRDESQMENHLKAELIKIRKEYDFSREKARELWGQIPYMAERLTHDAAGWGNDIAEILGDDWQYNLPKEDNPDYLYLIRIIETVKAAFKEVQGGGE